MKKREATDFGKNVLTLLDRRNLKVADMEQALHYGVGSIEKNYIYGKRQPNQNILELVSEYLQIRPEELLIRKIWLEEDIHTLKQELSSENFSFQEDLSKYSQELIAIVPEAERKVMFNEKIEQMPIGELLVAKKKARTFIYGITLVSAFLYLMHPLLSVKLMFCLIMCGCGILLNYTIKNKIKVDRYIEVFLRATFCALSVVSVGEILSTF